MVTFLSMTSLLIVLQCSQMTCLHIPSKSKADILIGGIFRTTVQNNNKANPNGLEEALAMVYAVDKINKDKVLLPHCTLGVNIKNSEGSKEIAFAKTMEFDFVQTSTRNNERSGQTVAVIGMRKSAISHTVSTLASAFEVPSVSYGSTDIRLSNNRRFPWFSRTIPNDELLTKVIIKLLETQQWNSLLVLFENTDFGYSGFMNLEELIEKKSSPKLCIFSSVLYVIENFNESMKDFGRALERFSKAKTVIFFVHKEEALKILREVENYNLTGYTFVFLDSINFKEIRGTEGNLQKNTVISLMPANIDKNSDIAKEYEKFAYDNLFDPALQDLIPNISKCVVVNRSSCFAKNSESTLVPYVIDAVQLIAHALNHSDACTKKARKLSMEVIRNVTFKSALGYDFKFDSEQNVQGRCDILQLKLDKKRRTEFVKVGSWSADNLTIDSLNTFHGVSQCNVKCDAGKGLYFEGVYPYCCGVCIECQPQEYRDDNTNQCKLCGNFTRPNINKTECVTIEEIDSSYSSPMGVIMMIFVACGQIVACIYIIVFVKYNDTHVIRASSWDISIAILIGALFSFSSPFTVMFYVSDISCKLSLICTSVSISLMIGALFLKTNRTYRIFSKHVLRKGLPRFLSTSWQFTIVFGIVSLALIISSFSSFDPENPVKYERRLASSGDVSYATCNYGRKAIVGLWIFLSILVCICTYQAVLSRKLPGNYREARNIMFTMLAITLELCFVLPAFFYASNSTAALNQQDCLSFISIVSAASTLIFLFTPKIYLVLFRSSENSEPLPHSTLGTFTKDDLFPSTLMLKDYSTETAIGNLHASGGHPVKRRKLTSDEQVNIKNIKTFSTNRTKNVWKDPVKRQSLRRQASGRTRTNSVGTQGGTLSNHGVI